MWSSCLDNAKIDDGEPQIRTMLLTRKNIRSVLYTGALRNMSSINSTGFRRKKKKPF